MTLAGAGLAVAYGALALGGALSGFLALFIAVQVAHFRPKTWVWNYF